MKQCTKCKKLKELNCFGLSRQAKDGLNSWCKVCKADRQREYRKANLELVLSQERSYRARHREEKRIRQAIFRKKNPNYHAEYREKNRVRFSSIQHNYRIRKLSGTLFEFDPELLMLRVLYFGELCWICKGPWQALDHVKPLSKGGLHIPANIRPICNSCNSKKGSKWPYVPGEKG